MRMIRRCIKNEEGNVAVAAIVAAPFIIIMMATLVSAQQKWEARREAQAVAAEAARIASQRSAETVRLDFGLVSDPAAKGEAESFITGQGHTGSVRDAGSLEAEATVTVNVDYYFKVPGLQPEVTATAKAKALRGVTEDGN